MASPAASRHGIVRPGRQLVLAGCSRPTCSRSPTRSRGQPKSAVGDDVRPGRRRRLAALEDRDVFRTVLGEASGSVPELKRTARGGGTLARADGTGGAPTEGCGVGRFCEEASRPDRRAGRCGTAGRCARRRRSRRGFPEGPDGPGGGRRPAPAGSSCVGAARAEQRLEARLQLRAVGRRLLVQDDEVRR